LCASDGSLWIATAHGPIFRIATDNAVEVFTNNLPDMIVQRLMEDADGDIWMLYTVGEVRRIHKGVVQRFSPEDGWPAGTGRHWRWMARGASGPPKAVRWGNSPMADSTICCNWIHCKP